MTTDRIEEGGRIGVPGVVKIAGTNAATMALMSGALGGEDGVGGAGDVAPPQPQNSRVEPVPPVQQPPADPAAIAQQQDAVAGGADSAQGADQTLTVCPSTNGAMAKVYCVIRIIADKPVRWIEAA